MSTDSLAAATLVPPMITIVGPTASGKTRLAVALAAALGSEVISADSRQVYRGMDLGTGKDLADYCVGGTRIACHLIDIRDPGYKYSIYEYQTDFLKVYDEMRRRALVPIVCGGSGLYVEAVLKGYAMHPVPPNPELRTRLARLSLAELEQILSTYKTLHNKTDTDTPQRAIREIEIRDYYRSHARDLASRPAVPSLVVGVHIDREERRARISARLRERVEAGMIDEVRRLLEAGVPAETLIYYGLEYRYLTLYVTGQLSYDEMLRQLEIAIFQFAKRQMTWFRGMERRGTPIRWLDYALPDEEKISLILAWHRAMPPVPFPTASFPPALDPPAAP